MNPSLATTRIAAARQRLAWLPIPLMAAAMVALWIADLRTTWSPQSMIWLIHYGPVALGLAFIVTPAARSFLASGQPSVLMLGCGVLMMDIGVITMPFAFARSTSAAFAIYNTSALLAALCHLAGVAIAARRKNRLEPSAARLAAVYAGAAAVVGLVIGAAFAGWMPVFFIDGQGSTLLRTLVVGAAVALFFLTAVLLWQTNRRAPSPFLFWYSLGLMLLALGLGGSVLIAVRDSPLQWAARITQNLAMFYMCGAALVSMRGSGVRGIALEAVQEAWRRGDLLQDIRKQPVLWVALRYGFAVVAVAVGWSLRLALTALIGPGLPTYITFYPAVMVAALLCGFGPGILATALTCSSVMYWIIPPEGQFAIHSLVDRVALVTFAGMGLFMSVLAELYRRNKEKAAAYDLEQALHETSREKKFLAKLLEHADQPFAVGYPDGRLGRLNRAFEQLTGYSAAELRALDWTAALTPPEWREMERQKLDELNRTGQPVRYEKEYIRKDGSRVPIELQVNIARDAEGKLEYYYSFVTDITGRKQAQQSRERLAEIVESSDDAIISKNLSGTIQSWNAGAGRLFGYSAAEIVGRSIDVLIPPERQVEEEMILQKIQRGERVEHFETVRVRKDGQQFDVSLTISPLKDARGVIIGSSKILRDITGRKRAEAAKLASEARYRSLFEGSLDAVFAVDATGRFFTVNPAAVRMSGYPAEELMAKTFAELCAPDCLAATQAAFMEGLAGQSREMETALIRKDGRRVELLISGSPMRTNGQVQGVFCVASDVTARKQAQAAMRIAHERLVLAQQASGAGIWDWDIRLDKLEWSPALYSIFGVDPNKAEASFDTWRSAVHADDRAAATERIELAIKSHAPLASEYRVVWPDGQVRWINALGNTTSDAQGQAQRMAGICIDITARKQAEEKLREAEREKSLILDNTNEAIAYLDTGNNLIWANKAYLDTIGLPLSELKGRKCYSCWGLGRSCDHCPVIAAIQTGEPQEAELTPENQPHWSAGPGSWLIRAAPIKDSAGIIIGAIEVARDVTARKQAEQAQRASDRFNAAVLDSLPAHIAVLNRQGIILAVNGRWRLFAQENNASQDWKVAVGANYLEVCRRAAQQGDALAEAALDGIQAVLDGRLPQFQLEYPCHSPTQKRWFLMQVTPVASGSDNVILSHLDITEREQAEETVRRSQKTFLELVERSPFGTYIVDSQFRIAMMNTASQEGAFRNVRPVVGRPLDEAMRILWPEPVAAGIIGHFRHTLETGKPYYSRDFINPRHDAEIVEAYEWELHRMTLPDGQHGVICYYYDSTKLRQAEAAVRKSEERLQQALRASHSFTFEWHPATDRVLRSDSCATILNLAGDDVCEDTGKHYFQRVHPDDRARFVQMLRELTPAAGTYVTEYRIVWGDGSVVVLEEVGRATFDAAGKLERLIGVTTDITARKAAEAALRESEERFRLALHNAPVSVAVQDRDLRYIWAYNQRTARPEEIVGRFDTDVFTPEEAARITASKRRVLEEDIELREQMWFNRPAGRIFLDVYWEPIHDAAGRVIGVGSATVNLTPIKLAEQALRQSEARHRLLAETMLQGVVHQNAEGKIIAMNPAAERILGKTREQFLDSSSIKEEHHTIRENGEPFPGVEHPAMVALRTGQPVHGVVMGVFNPKVGGYRWISIDAVPICPPGETRAEEVYTVFEDITVRKQVEETQRKQADEALRMSEQEFRSLAESMPQIVWATQPDGWNMYFNQQWVDYTGMTMEESYGHGWNTPFHPEDKPRAWEAWQRATQHGERYSLECRLRRRDGVYRWWLIRGEPMRGANGEILKWFGTCTDIEEIKNAEAALQERVAERTTALRESEERFRMMANAMPQLAWIANADGWLHWYNQRWYEYTGTTPEQMEGWGWQRVHDPVELPKVLAQWKASIETGKPFEMTFPLRRADGVFRLFLTRGFPLRDAAGRVAQWFGTNTDVTDLKRAEESLKASLAEKEVLLKEIHHRVKNNMQVLSSLVSLQADSMAEPALGAVFADMRDRVRSMALVHEKLYQSGSLAAVDFAAYAESLMQYLWQAHHTQAAVSLKLELEPVTLTVETAVPCGLILNELAANALKHAFRGRPEGAVTVAVRTGPDGRVSLRVSDNGVGLPAGLDWQQAKSLGLRLVQLLARQLGGTVEARDGAGTEFVVNFRPPEPGTHGEGKRE